MKIEAKWHGKIQIADDVASILRSVRNRKAAPSFFEALEQIAPNSDPQIVFIKDKQVHTALLYLELVQPSADCECHFIVPRSVAWREPHPDDTVLVTWKRGND